MPQNVLRLCVRTSELDEPVVSSERRQCQGCGAEVWYDPSASIPALGPELIVCNVCLDGIAES